MHVIHTLRRRLGACISCARDPCAGTRMSCHRRLYASKCLPWPAVLAVGPLYVSEVFRCMSCDWGITIIVHMHRGPNMFRVQIVICLNWTGSNLERSHAFVTGDVVQVQRK